MESRNQEIISGIDENIDTVTEINDESTGAEETTAPENKKRSRNPIKRMKEGGLFNLPFKIVGWTFLASFVIYLVSRFVPAFAEFWTKYPAHWIRFILAKITGWFPFSLAECLLVCIPVFTLAYIIASSVSSRRDGSDRNFYRWVRPMLILVMVLLLLFFAAFGPAYGRYTLSKNLGLEQAAVSADELFDTALSVSSGAIDVLDNVKFDSSGASIMPYDYNTLVEKVNDAFEKHAEKAEYISHFDSTPKAIALSEPMTYTHISGVYTFMTGEANINTNYPDFLMPFTMAHEMAHQRGIAREDEANFVAFLVCIGSNDDYIRYSGYANMANYLNSALSKADKDKYRTFYLNYLPEELQKEFIAYSDFFDKYRDSVAADISGAINDAYLQANNTAGTASYGLVVDLAVAYFKDLK